MALLLAPTRSLPGGVFLIMARSYIQHDSNCRKKEALSSIIHVGKNEMYGIFWRLSELFAEMQQHKTQKTETIVITESTLIKEIGVNRRGLSRVIEVLSMAGIRFNRIDKTIGAVNFSQWEVSMPQTLNFMQTRAQKADKKPTPKKTVVAGAVCDKIKNRNGSRYGCSLPFGHAGDHKWEELYSGGNQ